MRNRVQLIANDLLNVATPVAPPCRVRVACLLDAGCLQSILSILTVVEQ